jgi:ribosomal protein S27AE
MLLCFASPAQAAGWWQEAQEEDLHQAQEAEAQAQEDQAQGAEVLQGARLLALPQVTPLHRLFPALCSLYVVSFCQLEQLIQQVSAVSRLVCMCACKSAQHNHILPWYPFLQVDDSGKVSRLRKQCPQCGPGIFMATHFDRVYCGKCATTYLVEQEAKGKGKGKK